MTTAEFHKECFRATFNLLNKWRSELEQGIPYAMRWQHFRDEACQCAARFHSHPFICRLLELCHDEIERLELEGGGIYISGNNMVDRGLNHAQKIAGL